MRASWLLYGATGYTGERIARQAAATGSRPTLAARNGDKLRALAAELDLPYLCLALDDTESLRRGVQGFSAVLNAAGPFADTYLPLLSACLEARTHYLDIGGEVDVYEQIADFDDEAKRAGIMLMPGVGFDMVPGDCLALYLKEQLPDADELHIGMQCAGSLSRGTLRSAMRSMGGGTLLRRDGKLISSADLMAKPFAFGSGAEEVAYATTFGDLSIAWRTTGIANVTSYMCPSPELAQIFSLTPAQIDTMANGPDEHELRELESVFVGEVRNRSGQQRRARLVTPQVYAITFALAAAIAERVHSGEFTHGFRTPAAQWGCNFILGFDRCRRENLPG